MDLSAVIINYKSRDALANCLRALGTDARCGLEIETLVIDNDSRDGTPEMLAERFPGVKLIVNAENVGYARAVTPRMRSPGGCSMSWFKGSGSTTPARSITSTTTPT